MSLSLYDVERIEREVLNCAIASAETGGLSLVEVADSATRYVARLAHEYRSLMRENERLLREARRATAVV
jgi:hypothetical protein